MIRAVVCQLHHAPLERTNQSEYLGALAGFNNIYRALFTFFQGTSTL
jgi:hypothetical protein